LIDAISLESITDSFSAITLKGRLTNPFVAADCK